MFRTSVAEPEPQGAVTRYTVYPESHLIISDSHIYNNVNCKKLSFSLLKKVKLCLSKKLAFYMIEAVKQEPDLDEMMRHRNTGLNFIFLKSPSFYFYLSIFYHRQKIFDSV
jgi:hypothetical protein